MCLHCLFRFSRSRIVSVVRLFVGTMGVVGLYGIVGCCRIGDHVTINIEHCIHWILFQVNFTHRGSFTTCYKFCFFMKKGVVHRISWIHEVPTMWWLENGPYFHEGFNHLIDAPIGHPKQVHGDFICNRHIPKKIIMSHPKYVVLDPLVINV